MITKEEWMQKCYERFVEKVVNEEFDLETAHDHIQYCVESCWEYTLMFYGNEDILLAESCPIESADIEINYWRSEE